MIHAKANQKCLISWSAVAVSAKEFLKFVKKHLKNNTDGGSLKIRIMHTISPENYQSSYMVRCSRSKT